MAEIAILRDQNAAPGIRRLENILRDFLQFARPAFSRVTDLHLRYLPYSELRKHRETIARFGSGLKAIHAIAKPLR